ncbi:MAG: response regulator [Isosphaeraceae bacterium]|nr:response regulator [Isosphaeraceae bacterium]
MAKILLVDDNEENWEMLSRRLTRRGYVVVVARDGQQAVDMASSEAPDLILMDMNMPVIDGWEATRRIRATPELASIPIIAVTAHGMAGDREKILEAGCWDHHIKPVELTRLLAQIETMLKKGQGG